MIVVKCVDTRPQAELDRLNESIQQRYDEQLNLLHQAGLEARREMLPDIEYSETEGVWKYYCFEGQVESYITFGVQGTSLRKCACQRIEEFKQWLRHDGELCVRSRPNGLVSRIRAKLGKGRTSNRITSYMTLSEVRHASEGSRSVQLVHAKTEVLTYDWSSIDVPALIQACTNQIVEDRELSLQFIYAS